METITSNQNIIRITKFLIIITIVCIWALSTMPAMQSYSLSGGLKVFVLERLYSDHETVPFDLHLSIRQVAHLVEFGALAVELLVLAYLRQKVNMHEVATNFSIGLTVAFVDESIQIFSPGRVPKISDIWLGLAGFFLGTLLCFAILFLIQRRKPNSDLA